MFRNPFRKADASGFTREDKKILDKYVALHSDDHDAAYAFLSQVGWPKDYADAAFEHFYPAPPALDAYTDEQVVAAFEAQALFDADEDGNEWRVKLAEAGLTVNDVAPCREQYEAEVEAGIRTGTDVTN